MLGLAPWPLVEEGQLAEQREARKVAKVLDMMKVHSLEEEEEVLRLVMLALLPE